MKPCPCFCSTQELNTTAQAFRSHRRELIMGAPATDERMALQKITDLCIVRGWKRSRKLWIIEVLFNLFLVCFGVICLSAFRCSHVAECESTLEVRSLMKFFCWRRCFGLRWFGRSDEQLLPVGASVFPDREQPIRCREHRESSQSCRRCCNGIIF